MTNRSKTLLSLALALCWTLGCDPSGAETEVEDRAEETTTPRAQELGSCASGYALTYSRTLSGARAPLAGATVSGTVFVWANPSSDIYTTAFFLDDPTFKRTATHYDTAEPWLFRDVAGLDTRALTNGAHGLAAKVKQRHGVWCTVASRFTVANTVKPPPTPAWTQLGFYPRHPGGGGIEEFARLEAWLERDIPFMAQFGSGVSADAFRFNLQGQFTPAKLGLFGPTPRFRLSYAVPMAFGPRYNGKPESALALTSQWDMVIDGTGGRRELYRAAAELLQNAGYGNAIIRLGWEFDNPTSRWAAQANPEKFKQAWRIVHGIFREVSPDFLFDYNYVRKAAARPIIAEAYPGDDYVDIIGLNAYDSGYSGVNGVPEGQQCGWADPHYVWEMDQLPKLQTHLDFARAHGKPVSFPEWGLSTGGVSKFGVAGCDNPVFLQNMIRWFDFVGGPDGPGLAYHAYFQENDSPDGAHAIESFPESEALFRQLLGAQ